jgi:flagellar biosynthetic protein FliQ
MNVESAVRVAQEALLAAAVLSAPIVLVVALVGLAVSVVQAATQLQEQSVGVVAKTAAAYAVVAACGLTGLAFLVRHADRVFRAIADVAR